LRLIFFLGSQSFCFYLSLSKQLAKHDYEIITQPVLEIM
jgi:hypothetical protein